MQTKPEGGIIVADYKFDVILIFNGATDRVGGPGSLLETS